MIDLNILEVEGLNAAYGSAKILDDVSFIVRQGGITTLLGANGAGKTTTLRAISNIMTQAQGTIRLGKDRIDGLAAEAIVGRGVAHVPDGRGTFVDLTVHENLLLGGYLRPRRDLARDLERMYAYFPRLAERRDRKAGLLSGGEQQMLAISRALMSRPRLLMLDEPSFGLAPMVVLEIFQMLRKINESDQVGILLVEQNAALALKLADYAYVIENGRIALGGPANEVAMDERVRQAYLGN
jgi:branched-chain amino acid transport system ATP-binding protein